MSSMQSARVGSILLRSVRMVHTGVKADIVHSLSKAEKCEPLKLICGISCDCCSLPLQVSGAYMLAAEGQEANLSSCEVCAVCQSLHW